MNAVDITLLTDRRYAAPENPNWYVRNVLEEDRLIGDALRCRGFRVDRKSWDDPEMDWSSTRFALFRTTWDYFDRLPEFRRWFDSVRLKTQFINPTGLIERNIDKHYLEDLQDAGIPIPDTVFIEPGDQRALAEIVKTAGWKELILKPAVAGAARHTYRFTSDAVEAYEDIYRRLIREESMLLQEFQRSVLTDGEIAYMIFGGKFSHAILKRAKPGDFRVQDDFGGTVHDHLAGDAEIRFAEAVVAACSSLPVYARVDVILNNQGNPVVSELELVEPELWMRRSENAADLFADAVAGYIDLLG